MSGSDDAAWDSFTKMLRGPAHTAQGLVERVAEAHGAEADPAGWKWACREALGPERFAAVEAEASVHDDWNRPEVYKALADAAVERWAHDVLDPEWCKERDDAIEDVRQSILRLKAVLSDCQLHDDPGIAGAFAEGWVRALLREWRRLTEPDGWRAAEFGDAHPSAPFLAMTRYNSSGPKGGRPPATWRHEAEARLRAAGTTVADARHVLKLAGLTGKTPDG